MEYESFHSQGHPTDAVKLYYWFKLRTQEEHIENCSIWVLSHWLDPHTHTKLFHWTQILAIFVLSQHGSFASLPCGGMATSYGTRLQGLIFGCGDFGCEKSVGRCPVVKMARRLVRDGWKLQSFKLRKTTQNLHERSWKFGSRQQGNLIWQIPKNPWPSGGNITIDKRQALRFMAPNR